MLSSLDPSSQQFLNALNRISDRMSNAQRQITTGLKLSQVSDAPDSISLLLEARSNLSRTEQTLTNLGRIKTEADAGEQALQTAVQLFDKVQTLGAQGNTDFQDASGRATIAGEIGSILQQLVGIAGTSVEGRYIFSGDSDQQVPYTYTANQPNPVSAYLGSASTRVAEHPDGTTFSVALTAQQIFDSSNPAQNVFQSIQSLITALNNNDSAAIATAVGGLNTVGQYLNQQLAFYGTTQNKVAEATDFGNTLKTQLQTQISGIEDADLTQAIVEMNLASTQQQAALESRARIPRTTLFDYLG